jgi:gas vesicle protein
MTQREGFTSGFLAGAILGGVVGGILGTVLANRRDGELSPEEEAQLNGGSLEVSKGSGKRKQIKATTSEMDMEMTRRSLEDKIAQLNATIDEVRQQLGSVNRNSVPTNSDHITNS